MKEISDEHAAIDRYIAKTFADSPQLKPCCHIGCSACCSEPVYASEAEVLHILEILTPEQISAVKARLLEWLARTKPLMNQDMPDAVEYRKLNAPCVFLQGGLCSVYSRRPHGCRVWFALTNPENCDLPARKHQKYTIFPETLFEAIGSITCVNDKLILDHMGVLLAEKLLGIKMSSASRTTDSADRFRASRSAP